MILTTERLILRHWQEDDAEQLYLYASEPAIGLAAGWKPHESAEESRMIINEVFSDDNIFAVCLKDGLPIGSIGLSTGNNSSIGLPDDEGEIGYWLGLPFWGTGIMTEAAMEMVRHGFEDMGLARLWGGYFDGNAASARVLEKCGFAYERSRVLIFNGENRTEHLTSLAPETFQNRNT